jgi:hypothetical protein
MINCHYHEKFLTKGAQPVILEAQEIQCLVFVIRYFFCALCALRVSLQNAKTGDVIEYDKGQSAPHHFPAILFLRILNHIRCESHLDFSQKRVLVCTKTHKKKI